jgi:hypothetical protein
VNIEDATDRMSESLRELPELRVFDQPPDSLNPPAAIVGFPFIVFENDMLVRREPFSESMYRWPIPITVVIARSSDREARLRYMDLYERILEQLMTLDRNGICHLHLQRLGAIRAMQVAGGSYWAFDIVMEVWA